MTNAVIKGLSIIMFSVGISITLGLVEHYTSLKVFECDEEQTRLGVELFSLLGFCISVICISTSNVGLILPIYILIWVCINW